MQMVIDIPEDEYKELTQTGESTIALGLLLNFRKYIRNGTVLPKGHGRLIDAEPTIIEWKEDFKGYINSLSMPRDDYKGIMEYIDELPVTSKQKTGHWIPVKFRPLTDEEQKEYPDYCYMADSQMPDDGEEILISTKYGRVEKDECGFDDGYYLDSGYDWQTDIVAWMPLPEPYKAESKDKK